MKISYTCITGNYDTLHQPLVITPNWHYVCFTDNEELLSQKKVGVYEILSLNSVSNLDPVRLARIQKVFPLDVFDSEILVWNDANYIICCDLNVLTNKYLTKNIDLVLARHPQRSCLYQEAQRCIELKKDSEDIINKQIGQYYAEGVPKENGLFETGIMIRRKFTFKLSTFYNEWVNQIIKYSRRDQISLPYCLFKYSELAPRINIVNSLELRGNFIKKKHLTNKYGGKV